MESLPHSVVAAGSLTKFDACINHSLRLGPNFWFELIFAGSQFLFQSLSFESTFLSGWVPFTLVSLLTLLLSTLFVLWNRSSRFHSPVFTQFHGSSHTPNTVQATG